MHVYYLTLVIMEEHRFGEETENIRLLGMQERSYAQHEGEGALLDPRGRKRTEFGKERQCAVTKLPVFPVTSRTVGQKSCQRVLKLIYAFCFH